MAERSADAAHRDRQGGTFTDFTIWDGDPASNRPVEQMKVASSTPDFAQAVCRGLEMLLADGRIRADEPALLVHGTTVSTNAVI